MDADKVIPSENQQLMRVLISELLDLRGVREDQANNAKVNGLIEGMMGLVQSNCDRCLKAKEQDVLACCGAEDMTVEEVGATLKKRRHVPRTQHLLRLLCTRITDLIETDGAPTGDKIPRSFYERMGAFLTIMTGEEQFNQLNEEAGQLLDTLEDKAEDAIWPQIVADEERYNFAMDVLMRLALTFKDYNRARQRFINYINSGRGNYQTVLRESDFEQLFEQLFWPLKEAMNCDQTSRSFEERYGPNTVFDLKHVFRQQWLSKQTVERPFKYDACSSLSGGFAFA